MKTKVLVIDDEEDYRLIVGDVLRADGYEVLCVEDGLAGLEALKTFSPAVVLCDWMMPHLDGEAFCRELRAGAHRAVPLIMLTVKQTPDDEAQALGFGADGYLVKPFRPEELTARVREAVKK